MADRNYILTEGGFLVKRVAYTEPHVKRGVFLLQKACGIYEIENSKGRVSYKIFPDKDELSAYLKKNKDKKCELMKPVFTIGEYKEYQHTQVRMLTADEIERYMSERNDEK